MTADRREGRGRLSSIDLLPEEAEPDIVWALEQLRERTMPSNAILAEFNGRLADRGIAPVSKSAWGRYSVRKALAFRKLDETRRIASELVSSLGTDDADDMTVMVGEMVKLAAFQVLEQGELSAKEIMEVSRALASIVGAQKGSAEHRRRLQVEMEERLRKAAETVNEVGAKRGVTEETLAEINRALGVTS